MPKSPQELIHLKESLELELQQTVQKYQQQILSIENEITKLNNDLKLQPSDVDEPEGPWNVEHEGVIRHNGEEEVHLFEREQVFENIHE